ncbi:beta-propeller domain-containing protein [Methanoculleus bourgensis]|uniref:beta-propeller domain-containing protein n=1 Tax=Methanoculleus bourgensis TaxID=83986 RepID=UPI001BD93AC0|nr:beta-propeller domain-containing protein [Methanoculleus bourgensis]MBT0733960.1 beta-propeller domain-containing protein [Methanoculleus bourgensis]
MWNRKAVLVVVLGCLVIAAIIGTALASEDAGNETLGDLQKFSSKEEIEAFLKEHAQGVEHGNGYSWLPGSGGQETAMDAPAPTSAPPAPTAARDYSTTNVQVEGVDEADFLKNDGKYIYVISGETLAILEAFPAEEGKIVSETRIDGIPTALFLAGDRLVVFASGTEESMTTVKGSITPVPIQRTVTHAYIYDIADRSEPDLVRTQTFTGSYYDARMIGDDVYVLTREAPVWIRDEIVLPEVRTDGGEPILPDVYRPGTPLQNYVFYTASAFSVKNDRDTPDAETFLLGYDTTLFASQKNLYIGYRYMGTAYSGPVAATMPDYAGSREETIVHRFAIGDGRIDYRAMGRVPGHLLNQFSLDEYGENLRVATTVEGWTREGQIQYNNVYVLDPSMKTIGTLEHIAPDERIYAARFVGDRLYLVTFKRIDPLFVIDLSDPNHPGILGKLKIPGYSDYLHPYDADHIIGIGKETDENGWGGVSVGGLKLALFDVSDVNKPIQVDAVVIGEAGTDSEALRDHKAFLFIQEKDLLVIPVSEIKRVENPSSRYPGSYSTTTWQGAYVYQVNPSSGFTLEGTVTHGEKGPSYAWNAPDAVRRSLFMDDTLYTISQRSIVMTNLADGSRVSEVFLPYREGAYPPPYPVW